jgi:hypothetical protein
MAGHAYKSAVDELDAGVGRDLVCLAYTVRIELTGRTRLFELPFSNPWVG